MCVQFRAGPHLHSAKVNGLIVEVGTFSQPGKMTSGERQPEIQQHHLISILLADTLRCRESERERRREERAEKEQRQKERREKEEK